MSVLKNKVYNNEARLSRYTPFPYYYHSIDDKYVRGTVSYLKDTTPYTLHVVGNYESFDSLALKYYKNPTLYWIICSFNRIQDPYTELEVGTTIKIPSLSTIEFELL